MFTAGGNIMGFNLAFLNECESRQRVEFFKDISLKKSQQIFKDHPELA